MYVKELVKYTPNTGELIITSLKSSQTINSIVDRWNMEKSSFTGLSTKPFDMGFIYHADQGDYLYDANTTNTNNKSYYLFAQEELETSTSEGDIVPLIHFSGDNILLLEGAYRYKKIVDSSIWNHFINIKKGETLNKLKIVIKQIGTYYDEERYSLGLAYEYADLHARLTEQSHLIKGGPHSVISPFLFHSESEMRDKIESYKDKDKHPFVNWDTFHKRGYRWRFLLLDDKATVDMKDQSTGTININKLEIIALNLQHCLGFSEDNIWFRSDFILNTDGTKLMPQRYGKVKNFRTINNALPDSTENVEIVIDCVSKIEEALQCLEYYKYEVILLDYLLENEYGYQLLEKLHDWHDKRRKDPDSSEKDKYKAGPNERFFIMFISAYTTAVHERMLEKGFMKTEGRLWYIGDGACPTNTPYLFAYQLLLLMRHRIADLRKEKEAYCLTLIDLLYKIFMEKDIAGPDDIREHAHEHFSHLLHMRDKYHRLENDLSKEDEGEIKNGKNILLDTESSLLVQSAFRYVHHFSGSLFEHLQHMIYLIAFGTIRQWTELWEEYIFVQKTLTKYDELTGDKKKPGHQLVNAMRKYIINLKENSN